MKIRRRQFLALGAGSAGAVILTELAGRRNQNLLQPAIAVPQQHKSQDGLLELDLEAGYSPVRLGNTQAYLLSYNGQVPGPRLEAKPGDTVRIHFTNNLSKPTNLHYHGLHITPQGNADNVFLSIPPKERLTYEFTIPPNHPAATFWYHPHYHGLVAEQVFGGLAGLFIVRGKLDEIPEVKAAQEEFLVLQDFALDANGRILAPNNMALMMGREGKLITVNGQVNPHLSIAAGGLLRLRFLNASASRFYRLKLSEHPLHLIATDSGALAEPVEVSELLLAPGERAEVLVRGERQPGQYRLLNLPYNRGGMGTMGNSIRQQNMGGMMNGMKNNNMGNQSQSPQVLATLAYRGSISPLSLPKQLQPVTVLSEPATVRRFEMSMAMGADMKMAYMFNGKTFDAKRVDTVAKLGTIEDWDLLNVDPDHMEHPFHVHVNPFQVVARNGKPEPYRAWKDTVLVRADETVRIRMPLRDFWGKTVYHCHILDHEDLGMMGTLEIRA
jgi:FtsP/CotA-like multicopper oxidase with cupredoxin domain